VHGLHRIDYRAHGSTIEQLIFEAISLDYQHTLMAAAGEQSDDALHEAMKLNHGKYLLAVDGSIPLGNPGYSTISGISNIDMLKQAAEGAMAIVAIGSCAAFGGIPHANQIPPAPSPSRTSSRTNRSSTSPAARRFRSSSPACWRRS
jgi:NiFe hydrogenase small subunit HydA